MDGRVKPGHDGLSVAGAYCAPQTAASPAGRSASKTRVNALETRGSIVLRINFLRRRWMAGSSPAMTEYPVTSFAELMRAAIFPCNDATGFAVTTHGPHCDHRADALRVSGRVRAARRYRRVGTCRARRQYDTACRRHAGSGHATAGRSTIHRRTARCAPTA